jgi:hypothetical protein
MLDVATRFIGLEAENKQILSNYEYENSRDNVQPTKLKAAKEALEEGKASLGPLNSIWRTRDIREKLVIKTSVRVSRLSTLIFLVSIFAFSLIVVSTRSICFMYDKLLFRAN